MEEKRERKRERSEKKGESVIERKRMKKGDKKR